MARRNLRQRASLKTSLRQSIIAVTTAVSCAVVLLLVVFNLFKDEKGHASGTAMLYKSATVIQETTNVLRGARNQVVIGLRIDMAGSGNPVKVASLTFNAEGTSQPVEQNICNARLWFTGGDAAFNVTTQVGSTIKLIDSKDFSFQVNKEMQSGANYFWLTYDVHPDAQSNPASIDAVCREIRIGAISYRPFVPAPDGKRLIEANVPYFSMGNLVVNKADSWNSRRDGSGVAPRQLSAQHNSYFIQSGHVMVSSNGGNFHTLVIENGGDLKITSPLRLNTVYVACGGKVQQDATITDYYCFNDFILEGGATYIHNNTGMFPGHSCHFDPASTVQFMQYSKMTFERESPVTWGNVLFTSETNNEVNLEYFRDVKGSFELKSNSRKLSCAVRSPGSYAIEGSMILNGATFLGFLGKSSESVQVKIGRDLKVSNGTFTTGSQTQFNLMVCGDIEINEGSMWLGFPNATVFLSGNGTTRWSRSSGSDATIGNVKVESGHQLHIVKGDFAEIAPRCTFNVMPGGSFFCGTSSLTGEGTFELADHATIGIGHAEGLYSSGDKGNIRTAHRNFSSGATYCYYASVSPQETGVFETKPLHNTVRRLILDKSKKTQTLTLSQPLTIEDQFRIAKGDIRTGVHELKVPRMEVSR